MCRWAAALWLPYNSGVHSITTSSRTFAYPTIKCSQWMNERMNECMNGLTLKKKVWKGNVMCVHSQFPGQYSLIRTCDGTHTDMKLVNPAAADQPLPASYIFIPTYFREMRQEIFYKHNKVVSILWYKKYLRWTTLFYTYDARATHHRAAVAPGSIFCWWWSSSSSFILMKILSIPRLNTCIYKPLEERYGAVRELYLIKKDTGLIIIEIMV